MRTALCALAALGVLSASAVGFPSSNPLGIPADVFRMTKPLAREAPPVREADFRTPEIVVRLRPGASASQVAAAHGLRWVSSSLTCPGTFVLRAASVDAAARAEARLRSDRRVWFAGNNLRATYRHDQFVPNDPFFSPNQPAPPWPGQWYLRNQMGGTIDLRVQGAWQRGLTGQLDFGVWVPVGIVDDGVEFSHPDLAVRFRSSLSFDFGQNNADPSPVYSDDDHGTAVAGILAGAGGNGLGITGVAPVTTFGMLRLDFGGFGTAQQEADAIRFRSVAADPTIRVKNHSYGPTVPFAEGALQVAAFRESAAAGTIHVRSAGNARGTIIEDANKQAERNIPEVITIAAAGSDGFFADYSNFGANVFATAPSSTDGGLRVLATDRTTEGRGYNGAADPFPDSNYTSLFGGTSAASAMAAGVMVLGVHAQPALDVRFAKHLLARTSRVIDPNDASDTSDGGWRTNDAGFRFNQNYGFGLIDADAFTLAATQWAGVTPLQTWSTGTVSVGAAIPDNSAAGVTRTFSTTHSAPLEEVRVTLNITHTYRGDLEAHLTSPRGTRSRLFMFAGADGGADISNFTFTSNAFWGENPAGTWTLNVRDLFAADTGTWLSYGFELRSGTLIPLTTQISGQVEIGGLGDLAGREVTFWLRDPGTQTVRDTLAATLDAAGAYAVATTHAGTFDIVARGPSTLRRVLRNVLVSRPSTSGVNFTGAKALLPGDIDASNVVDLSDFLILAATYEVSPPSDPRADLDGNGAVDLSDFLLLAANYDTAGED
jgi:subtilisin-like proprotein convertase family protein